MKIKALIVAALLLLPVHAFAAIAFDSATEQRTTATLTDSFSHTGTGSNLYVLAICFDYSGSFPAATTATYNGVAMTQIAQVFSSNPSGQDGVTMLGLMAPPTGTVTFTATRAVATGLFDCHVASYTGAAQTGQPDNSTTLTLGGSVTSYTITLTPNSLNDWVFMGVFSENGGLVTGTNATLRGNILSTVDGIWDNNAAINPIAATSLNVTTSAGFGMEGIMASIAPAGGSPAAASPSLLLATGFWW